jgi:hypothetical protein
MTGLSPASLIAIQSYGAAATQRQQQRQHAPQAEPQKAKDAPPPPRFSVDDKVTLQGVAKKAVSAQAANDEKSEPASKRDDGVGRREAVNPDRPAFKRPGSLVDLKA